MADKKSNREKLNEITASIEQGIKELFQSDKYAEYLRTMSRFHSYSARNTILIHMQRPDATAVAGFNAWKNKFQRHVKKGEKGITILAPTPFKKTIEEKKLDPVTKAPVLDQNGNAIMEEKEIEIPMFRPVKVFDVSQTEGKPLPQLSSPLTGDVRNYEIFMEALRRTSPVPIGFKPLEDHLDGFFNSDSQSITLREGMSEVQTICAAVHEITHSLLHNREKDRLSAAAGTEQAEKIKPKDRNTEEVEAESVSYAVCQYYGIETGENSLGYIATWSKDRSLPELKDSLETIGKTANQLITDIDRHFKEICKERGIDLTQPEQAVPDTPEKFISDFFAYMDELSAAKLISVPYQPGERETFENIYLHQLRNGRFDGFRKSFDTFENISGAPPASDLRDRLETMSDQWDAKLVYKIEPAHNLDGRIEGCMIQAYANLDGQLIPDAIVFSGTERDCQSVMANLESGTFTLRQVRQPDFKPPEPEYVYKMEANARTTGADDQHFIQAYIKTKKETLVPGPVLFIGNTEKCAELLERLNNGSLQHDDFVSVSEVRASCYTLKDGTELDAFVDLDKKVYLGRHDHYDNQGHYLNDGKSMIHVSDTYRVFDLISEGTPHSLTELLETNLFSQKEFEQFTALQFDVLEPVKVASYILDTTLDKYPVPDPLFLPDELEQNYGYTGGDLLPLSKDRAAELLERDLTIYAIVDGGQAEMVFDRDDLEERPPDMVFGVPKEEWEASQDFREAVADRMNHQEEREKAFLDHRGDCFAIYQVKFDDERRFIAFSSLERLHSDGYTVDRANYDLVYTGELAFGQDLSALEKLYERFNIDHPADYHRPSMSVSDIVAIKQDGVVSFHYCDSIGFVAVPDFIKPENYLKAAEMSLEDDYGMIDGIINNGPKEPTVAQLEQQARSGQPISLMELAAATHREEQEKKKSVVKRLKNQPKQEQKRTAPKRSAERDR